jgi:hypothetical protein
VLCSILIWVVGSEGCAWMWHLNSLWKDCLSMHNVSIFTWLWLSSSRDRMCNILAYLVKTMGSRKWC